MSACRTILFLSLALLAQSKAESQTTNNAPELPAEGAATPWSFGSSVYAYLIPHSHDYINPNLTADHGWFHLEARYNYEALDTGSLWVGYNFSVGEKLVFEATPMMGGIFGDTSGVAPGGNLSLSYKRFNVSSQSEYFVHSGGSSGNFFYTWSELTYSPWEWFRTGLVVQRTKAYHTSLDIQRGLMVGVTYKKVDLATYVFNFGWTDPTVVVAVTVTF
jgi:hypothetical protein